MSDCSKGDIEMKLLVVEDDRAEHGADVAKIKVDMKR